MSEERDTWRGARFSEHVEKPQTGLAKPRIRVPAKDASSNDLPPDLEALVDDLEHWKAAHRKSERMVKKLRQEVLDGMAGRVEATCGPWRLVINTQHRKAHDVHILRVTREA